MGTECSGNGIGFQGLSGREVVGQFDGGLITSDGGGLLLREVEGATRIIEQFAACFRDYRDSEAIEHGVYDLVAQRVYALALGYEDLNDHDELRRDPLLAVLVGKGDPLGEDRLRARDRGKALAGKSTLNRLELTPAEANASSRYKKIVVDEEAVNRFLVNVFLESHGAAPEEIVLDVDATDDPLHGKQEGRFFHGYYRCYCYLPLYVFCGAHLLCARLRESGIDASYGAVDELSRIVGQIRERWPKVKIVIRGDSGFCREELMAWCEGEEVVEYVLGLAKNARLSEAIGPELEEARAEFERTGSAARVYKDFRYKTLESWSRERRVIGKAEHLSKGSNPRFVVTSVLGNGAAKIYAKYCARGEMENRIKEQQLYLFSDRTSTAKFRGNQIRLWFSSVAYLLVHGLRRLGLRGTKLARAQAHTIREKLLKIGAQIRVTVRKVWISLAGGYPYEEVFRQAVSNVREVMPLRC
ncbi:MAG: IS1380 family transposase [bacterium]|nr:IS1380 family transposase [bacterium]